MIVSTDVSRLDMAVELAPIGAVPSEILPRLAELEDVLPADTVVTLCRDWEGIPGAYIPDSGVLPHPFLTFTADGRVALYDRNLPVYRATVADLLA